VSVSVAVSVGVRVRCTVGVSVELAIGVDVEVAADVVQTCKHLQINQFVYLREVIDRASTHPVRLTLELTTRQGSICGYGRPLNIGSA